MFRDLTPLQRATDALIAVAFVLLATFSPLVHSDAALIPVSLVLGAALALRRWSPALALTVAWAAAVLQMGSGFGPVVQDAAIPPIIYACAAYGSRPVRWAAFSSSLVGGGVAGIYSVRSGIANALEGYFTSLPSVLVEFGLFALLTAVTLLLAWTLGVLVATGRQSIRNRREADSASREVAAEQERTRIARDMHDVVAHSLAVVIAQSDGARLLRHTDPDAVEEALNTIGATSRAALADVRVLLQQLRYEGTVAVQPGLADLDVLVDRFRASGLEVQLNRTGDAEAVGTAVQLAAFRIVQESLTNALRHGDTTQPAQLSLARTAHGLDIEVVSALPADRTPRASNGHGLIGMQERAATVQGHLRAEAEGDRFVVHAWLPAATTATGALRVALGSPSGAAVPGAQ